jgi:hypothetical protein
MKVAASGRSAGISTRCDPGGVADPGLLYHVQYRKAGRAEQTRLPAVATVRKTTSVQHRLDKAFDAGGARRPKPLDIAMMSGATPQCSAPAVIRPPPDMTSSWTGLRSGHQISRIAM